MATKLLPLDIKAEVVLNYMRSHYTCTFDLCGSHKRNAYRDILKMEVDDEEKVCNVLVDRNGLYDILPEGLLSTALKTFPQMSIMSDLLKSWRRRKSRRVMLAVSLSHTTLS